MCLSPRSMCLSPCSMCLPGAAAREAPEHMGSLTGHGWGLTPDQALPATPCCLSVLFKKIFKFSVSSAVTENCQLCYCVAHSVTGWVKPAFCAAVGGVWPGCGGDPGSAGERAPHPAGRAGREVLPCASYSCAQLSDRFSLAHSAVLWVITAYKPTQLSFL